MDVGHIYTENSPGEPVIGINPAVVVILIMTVIATIGILLSLFLFVFLLLFFLSFPLHALPLLLVHPDRLFPKMGLSSNEVDLPYGGFPDLAY